VDLEPMLSWGCKAQGADSKVCRRVTKLFLSQMLLERAIVEGDSPVGEKGKSLLVFLSTTGHVESCGKQGGPSSKAKYC
jgi:hypothetical protein